MKCTFAESGVCQLSSALARIPVPLDDNACEACQQSPKPMELNSVTCARAVWALSKQHLPVDPEIFDCIRASQMTGPGTELKLLLARWAEPNEGCGCKAIIVQMNQWGVEGCLANVDNITDHVYGKAIELKPWVKFVPIARRYLRSLVRKAISNASRKNFRSQSGLPQG